MIYCVAIELFQNMQQLNLSTVANLVGENEPVRLSGYSVRVLHSDRTYSSFVNGSQCCATTSSMCKSKASSVIAQIRVHEVVEQP